VWYPFIFFICNLASLVKDFYRLVEDNDNIFAFTMVTDEFLRGIQGAVICIVFFWKNRTVDLNRFFKKTRDFSEPTLTDLQKFQSVSF